MKKRRMLALLLSLAMVLAYMPAFAFADAETPDEQTVPATEDLQTEVPEAETEDTDDTVIPDADISEDIPDEAELVNETGTASGSLNIDVKDNLADNDELLMGYLEQGMPQNAQESDASGKAGAATRGSKLEGNTRLVYVMLYNAIVDLTDDDKAEVSTQYGIYTKNLTLDQTSFTKEQLGVSKLVEGDSLTAETIKALLNGMGVDYNAVLNALLSDMPYYLYWFDKTIKTGGMDLEIENVSTEKDSEGEVETLIVDNSEIVFSFTVANEYRDNGNQYRVNINKIIAANNARRNAANIITENQDRSDYMKLVSYMENICDLTSYDEAAGRDEVRYGDPWQMVNVFDGDKSTEVVCEGYSKAFQFLCDNSEFYNDIACNSVTGKMKVVSDNNSSTEGEDHMWNILHMITIAAPRERTICGIFSIWRMVRITS